MSGTGTGDENKKKCSVFQSDVDQGNEPDEMEEMAGKFKEAGWAGPKTLVGAEPSELVESLGGLRALD